MKNINLSYLLDKRKINLHEYCKNLELAEYTQLLEHCKIKNYNCDITQSNFNDVQDTQIVEKNENKASQKNKTKPRNNSRKSKTKKVRNSS